MQQNVQDTYNGGQYPPPGANQAYGANLQQPGSIPLGAPYGTQGGYIPAGYAQPNPYGQPQMSYQAGYAQPYQQPYPYQQAPPSQGGFRGRMFNDMYDGPADKLLTSDLDISIRNGFVRKVYGILSVQLLITFGIAAFFNLYRGGAVWLYQNPWLLIVAAAAMCASLCALSCVPSVARKSPGNYMLMGVIAVCMGLVLGFSTGAVDTIAFTTAAGMTAVVTIAVSLFACQSKWDFTGCGVYAFVGLMLLMVFGMTSVFFYNNIVHLVYATLGAGFFSFYIIMDTQRIVGGKHRAYQFSIDDYCFAAITLYMDIVNLFMYILQIVAATRDN